MKAKKTIQFLIFFWAMAGILPSFGQEGFVYVKGDIYIESEITLDNYDLVLNNAEVSGDGKLRLESSKPQEVVSHHSSIQNLEIITDSHISVEGELTIRDSLVVSKGKLDTQKARVTLEEASHVSFFEKYSLSGKLFNQNGEEILLPETEFSQTQKATVQNETLGSLSITNASDYEIILKKITSYKAHLFELVILFFMWDPSDVLEPPPNSSKYCKNA